MATAREQRKTTDGPLRDRKHKRPTLLRDLRQRIVAGEWRPGDRLPPREDFEKTLGASRVTVQRVFDRLVQEGFVEVNGRRETRIAADPPHLSRYALAFPTNRASTTVRWNRFWGALSDVATSIRRADDSPAVLPFFNIDGHADVRDYEELLIAMRHHLVAGIIFPSNPVQMLLDSPLFQEPGMPRVAITARADLGSEHGISTIDLDNTSFFVKACGYLQSQGCTSVGLILPAGFDVQQHVLPILARYGLACPHYWIHRLLPASAEVVSSIIPLMLRHASDRPEGLIIANDHFTDPATQGLISAGVRVPEDICVVVHENFPFHTAPLLKFKRLGFDAHQVLRTCVNAIDAQRSGGRGPTRHVLPALFEDELTTG